MVVLSTASPYKFPAAVLKAIGEEAKGDEFDQLDQLCAVTGVPIPKNLAALRTMPERHKAVIDKDKMLDFVLAL
jgi:threonine synthase